MNKIVVIGVAVVVVVAAIAAILLLNHPNSNNNSNYSSVNTVVTPTTSTTTTTTITTSTPINTSPNLTVNSLYFINENSSGHYYMFVLNLTSYEKFLQLWSVPKCATITCVVIHCQNIYMKPVKIIEKGDYLIVIGCTNSNISLSIGNCYFASFMESNGDLYNAQITYEGTWTGSIP
jgi:hypothetical protein